ncbi:unnamed protein product [Gongylonema pulchrum]|uniref:PPM-type phosphatase domain-containing protein n=1 Tax=Gongylonema pulchrum TaxID=637853 RepID=A0A183D411_9BILA|nr:unnamed protein product [Gongylonema pulchrum]
MQVTVWRAAQGSCSGLTPDSTGFDEATIRNSLDPSVAEKLSLMEFFNFYKDIIERVDRLAEEDYKRQAALHGLQPQPPVRRGKVLQTSDDFIRTLLGANYWPTSPSCPAKESSRPKVDSVRPQVVTNDTSASSDHPPIDTKDSCNYSAQNKQNLVKKGPSTPNRRRYARKKVSRTTSLPTIEESCELSFSEVNDSPKNLDTEKHSNDAASLLSAAKGKSHAGLETTLVKNENVDSLNNIENINTKCNDKTLAKEFPQSCSSYTAVAIALIYGQKLFAGSLGDSRVILIREKNQHLHVVHVNEPPYPWYPVSFIFWLILMSANCIFRLISLNWLIS